MNKAIKRASALALCFTMLLCGSAGAVSRADIDALEREREELAAGLERAEEQLEALRRTAETELEKKSLLDEESALLLRDMELLEEQITLYEGLIGEKRIEAQKAEARRDEHYALYLGRVRAMEEGGSRGCLSYLLGADSIGDLISRITDISDIMSCDEKLREDYDESCRRAEEALEEYRAVQLAQRQKRTELLESRELLEEKIALSAAVIAELEEDMEAYAAFSEETERELSRVQKEIDEKAEELRRQQEAENAAKPLPGYTPGQGGAGSGYYIWPSACTYITSPFGPRVHPIYGMLKPHTGVDIGAQYGSEIYASASGTVSAAVTDYGSTGYGTYVAIYHPNGTTTLYGHMSALAVSPGQSVSQGQIIGYVGSTGASNGPHIHFEIRLNGACVDPMLYF